MKNKTYVIIGTVAILLGVFLLGVKFYKDDQAKNVAMTMKLDKDLLIRPYSPRLGPLDAPVKVVEFLDPACESCRAFHPYTKALQNEFPGKVQLVVRFASFHPGSYMVNQILLAAKEQGRFWETLSVLFEGQSEWASHDIPHPERVWKCLSDAQVDVEVLKRGMMSPEIEKWLQQDKEDGEKLGVHATPTFFVNGKPLEEFSPDGLKDAVRTELASLLQ